MEKHTLGEYLRLLQDSNLVASFDLMEQENQIIDFLTYDSNRAIANTLFICKGATFKEEYLKDAVAKGTVSYISQEKYNIDNIPYIIVKDIREAMPIVADKYNNSPWKDLTITAFGGTKGKSTSAYYMKYVVDDYMESIGGKESAIISSVNTYDGKMDFESHITTPESVELYEHFRNALDSGISFAEMEVSSQALKCNRLGDIKLDVGVFLNISEDHISPIEHPDFEDYLNSKLKIFEKSKYGVVNLDADCKDQILEASKVCEKTYTISTKDENADIYGYDIHKEDNETVFNVKGPDFDEEFRLTMPGLFNVENALAVIAASSLIGIPMVNVKNGLYIAKTSGRMEMYVGDNKDIIALVDYAHNKLSFQKLYSSVAEEYPEHNIVAIFGCPGGKAFNRREDLGLIAGEYSSKVYIVAEDPGKESVEQISNDIAKFVAMKNCPYKIIEDRGKAIKDAIETADGKTILLITGKGNETRQKYGNEYIDCPTDVEYVKMYLNIQ